MFKDLESMHRKKVIPNISFHASSHGLINIFLFFVLKFIEVNKRLYSCQNVQNLQLGSHQEAEMKTLQDKLKQSEQKLAEVRNQCQSLRQELKVAQKVDRILLLLVQGILVVHNKTV